MKRITILLAIVGIFSLQGCTTNDTTDYVDNDTISEVFEVNSVSFNSLNAYSRGVDLVPAIYPSDMVLVYRLSGIFQGQDVWKLLPESYYFSDGTLDFAYHFDFTMNDVSIYMVGNDLQSVLDQYRSNQTFRIVIIPGYLTNKSVSKVKFSDYNAVISAYGIDDSKVKVLN